MGNVSKISAKFNKQSKDLPEITLKLKEVLVSVKAVMDDLSRTTPQLPRIAENMGDATDSIPVLMLQTQQVMAELEQLVKQLQSSWLLGGKAGENPGNLHAYHPWGETMNDRRRFHAVCCLACLFIALILVGGGGCSSSPTVQDRSDIDDNLNGQAGRPVWPLTLESFSRQ